MRIFTLILLSVIVWGDLLAQTVPQNYVFFNRDRERIHEHSFLNNESFVGAQVKYTWRELEPQQGKYRFEAIVEDLAFLQANGKKLFIQIQDVSFGDRQSNVPQYLLEDSTYHGGVAQQYQTDENDSILSVDGFVARRWDSAVNERFFLLLRALGASFDGKIEGINLPETAVGFGETGKLFPAGFSPSAYRDAILLQMERAKEAFPKSVVIQYANFMPGEWLPYEDQGYLASVYAFGAEKGIGMGGPDIKVYRPAQMNHSYQFLHQYADQIPTGLAVQWGNYEVKNPKTNQQVKVEEIYEFAVKEAKVDYIFWCTQNPYYSKHLPKMLKERKP